MMTEVTLKVPQEMSKMIAETSQTFYLEAIKEVVAKRLAAKRQRFLDLQKEIQRYEGKYRLSYQEFAAQLPDTIEAHDDWIEWSYLIRLSQKLGRTIRNLELLIGQDGP